MDVSINYMIRAVNYYEKMDLKHVNINLKRLNIILQYKDIRN